MEGLEGDEAVEGQFEFADEGVVLSVFVFYLDPEIARHVDHVFGVVEEELLVEVGVLSVLDENGVLLGVLIWQGVLVEGPA